MEAASSEFRWSFCSFIEVVEFKVGETKKKFLLSPCKIFHHDDDHVKYLNVAKTVENLTNLKRV